WDADDVREDDLQPQPERPQALLHGPQQHRQPAPLPRLAARADVLGQDAVVLHLHQAAPGPAADERPGGVRRAARRLHRPPEVPAVSAPESVAIGVVTYNRAELLARMLAGLATLDRRPDAVIVVDNASTDDTAAVLAGEHDLPLQVIRSEEN